MDDGQSPYWLYWNCALKTSSKRPSKHGLQWLPSTLGTWNCTWTTPSKRPSKHGLRWLPIALGTWWWSHSTLLVLHLHQGEDASCLPWCASRGSPAVTWSPSGILDPVLSLTYSSTDHLKSDWWLNTLPIILNQWVSLTLPPADQTMKCYIAKDFPCTCTYASDAQNKLHLNETYLKYILYSITKLTKKFPDLCPHKVEPALHITSQHV